VNVIFGYRRDFASVKISVLCVISAFEQSLMYYKRTVLWQRNRTMPL